MPSSPATAIPAGTASSTSNQYTETYSRILPLSIRTGQDTSTTTTTSSSSLFGRPGMSSVSTNSSSATLHLPSSTVTSVRVSLTYPTSTLITPSSSRHIRLTLTNDSDPLFYFHLVITEQDYPTLKQNQGLLVDFINFPSQLIGLLDKCSDDKFILVLKYSTSINSTSGRGDPSYPTVLDIVESNPFKYLSHLSLTILPGSDLEVKKYLSELTVQLKDENETLRTKFQHLHSSLEAELAKNKFELEKKNEEVAQLREEMFKESTMSLERYMRELGQEKEKLNMFQNELTRKLTQEKSELERNLRDVIAALESKVSAHENDKFKLEQKTQLTELKLKETESKLKVAEDDIKLLNHELQTIRKNNSKLDSDYHEKQRVVSNLVNKLNEFEAELKEKSSLITRQQELIASLGDKCRGYEERSLDMIREFDNTNSQLKHAQADLAKANEIIRKMQDDGRHLSKQLKTTAGLAQAKDSEFNEKTQQLEIVTRKLNEITVKFEANENELAETRLKLDELKETVETQKEHLQTKETMITWLNKQLNQSHGLTSLSQFREKLASTSLQVHNSTGLNESPTIIGPLASSRLTKSHDPLLLENSTNNNNQNTSNIPSWMNLYSNNTGRSPSGLFANLNSTVNATTVNTNANKSSINTGAGGDTVSYDDKFGNSMSKQTGRKSTGSAPNAQRTCSWAKPSKKVTLQLGGAQQPNWRH